MTATPRAVQTRLRALGYDPGPVDGILGRKTIAAIKAFQRDHKLSPDGIVGPITTKALNAAKLKGGPGAPVPPAIEETLPPAWILEARRFLGLHEVTNAKVLDKALRLDASEIAWCGAFVGMVLATALPSEPLPANPLGSRNWLKLGSAITSPQVGAVAVFWRGSKTGWQGHVGFVVGHDKTHLHVLGGNQSNKVSIARVAKDRLLGLRWPTSAPAAPTDPLPLTTISAAVTTNEA